MSKHSWKFDLKDNKASCCCGSWINLDIVNTGQEHYGTGCFDDTCLEEYYEAVKQYNSAVRSRG